MSEEEPTEEDEDDLPRCGSLEELARLVSEHGALHVRYSEGPAHDRRERSVDTESGLELPGLSVNPLSPEAWWTRPLTHWLSRQLCQYRHLQERMPERYAWVLTGEEVGRGPDCEPLLSEVVPVAVIAESALDEAERLYARVFDRGRGPGE